MEDFIPISEEELLNEANKMNNNKAPGPDGIQNVAIKAAIKSEADFFVNLYLLLLLLSFLDPDRHIGHQPISITSVY